MITSAGGAPPRTDAAASDAAEVLTIHEAWFASAMGLDVERMRPNYVSGPHMRMYNTDGHTYIGVEELVRSWEAWHGTMDVHACEGVSEPVEVAGDIAWLVVDQVEMRCRALSPEGHGAAGRHTRGGHVPTSNPAPPPVGTRISIVGRCRGDGADGRGTSVRRARAAALPAWEADPGSLDGRADGVRQR